MEAILMNSCASAKKRPGQILPRTRQYSPYRLLPNDLPPSIAKCSATMIYVAILRVIFGHETFRSEA